MLDPAARAKLLEVFQEEGGDYPSKERREELARDLGLPLVKVSNWFGSKRFSEKKNLDKNNRKKKKEEKKKKSTGCPFERARARVLSQCQRIRKEQWLLETYAMEGWRGASKEKLKPRQELERASRSIAKAKETIQDSMRFIEEGGGHTPIPKDLYTNSGELDQGEIFCGKCLSGVAHDDNDIVLCDGFCGCAFHQKCLDPPLEVIPEDDGWLCPSCSVKCDCIYYLNNLFNTSMPLETPWHAIYTYEEDNSDSDSENENERGAEGSGSGNGKKRKRKRDYHRGKPNESEGGNAVIAALNAIANTDDEDESEDDDFEQQESESSESSSTSSESSEVIAEVVEGKRRRTKVDYRKLNEAMFGEGEAYEGEVVSDQEWNPLSSPEASKPETSMKAKKMPSKNRPYQSTLDPVAYEKLREVFRETDYPSKERRKKLAEELKLPIQKVNNWFGSQRFHLKKKNTITEGGTTTPKRRSLDDLATNGFGGGKDALFAAINALSNSDEQRESEGDDSEEQESMESESSESSSTSSESSEVIAEVVEGKRRRTKVDYRKLNEAMFGEGEAYEGEVVSDQEWNPLSSPEASKPETSMKAKKMPSKNRPYQSTLDPVAYEKLREVFRETDYPSKERRKKLAEELKLPIQKVNNWFGSQRFHLKKKNTISEGGATTPKRRSLDDLATNGSRLGHDVVLSSGERKDKDKDKGTVASGRSMLDSAASAKLHQVFRETQTPSKERREELAREFNLPIKKVNNWFGSQRFRLKKKANTTTAQGDYYEEKRQEDESGEENPLFAALHVISQVEEKKKTPSKQQKSRSNLDPAAAAKFREVFQETPLPSKEKREELAREFNLPIKKVSNWFGSQRFQLAKARKKPDVNDTALQMQQNTRLIIEQYVRAESLQGVTPD